MDNPRHGKIELEQMVEQLADEVALMRMEFARNQARLTEILDRAREPASNGVAAAVAGSSTAAERATSDGETSENGATSRQARGGGVASKPKSGTSMLEAETSARSSNGGAERAGLKLSHNELALMVAEAGADGAQNGAAGRQEKASAGLSLERLARTLRQDRDRVGVTAKNGDNEDRKFTLSLAEVARLLRDAQGGVAPRAQDSRPAHRRLMSLDELDRALRGAQSSAREPSDGEGQRNGALPLSLGDLAKMLKSARSGADAMVAGPAGPSVPSGRPDLPAHATATPTKASAPVLAEKSQQKRIKSEAMPTVKAEVGHDPLVIRASIGTKLDVNLLTNLARWTGSVKRRLGVRNMLPLLEVYRSSGHLAPAIEAMVLKLARLPVMVDDSEFHDVTVDDLVEAIQTLHGIVYGSGRAAAVSSGGSSLSSESLVADAQDSAESGIHGRATAAELQFLTERLRSELRGEVSENGRKPGAEKEAVGTSSPVAVSDRQLDHVTNHSRRSERGDVKVEGGGDSPDGPLNTELPSNGSAPPESETTRSDRPTDTTDEEWRRLEPLIPPVKAGGRPGKYERREIVNGILYRTGTGCSWRRLPGDLPPWKIVHHYFRTWRADGTWMAISDAVAGHRRDWESLTNGAVSFPAEDTPPTPAGNGQGHGGSTWREKNAVAVGVGPDD